MRKLIISIAALAFSLPAAAQSTNWAYASNEDPFTDEHASTASTQISDHSALVVGCLGDGFYIAATTDYIDLEIGDMRQVSWRVDHDAAVSEAWVNRDRGGALLVGDRAENLALATRLQPPPAPLIAGRAIARSAPVARARG